jgi:hypothetical protein
VDEILARAGIFHAVEPDVASALTIRMTRSTSLRTDTTTKQRTTARLYSQSPQEVPAHTNVSDAFCITVRIVLLHHETTSNPTTDQRGCSSVAKLLSPVGMNLG